MEHLSETERNQAMYAEAMFSEAVTYVVRNVSAWNNLSTICKNAHIDAIHHECIADIQEGKEPAQAFADAVFRLLKVVGCSGVEAANIWGDAIRHSFSAVNNRLHQEQAV